MKEDLVEQRAEALGPWYHAIQLTPDYCTKSYIADRFAPVWEMIRQKMSGLDYAGKTVLDLGTMDGYWAFRAELREARLVVAGDIWQGSGVVNDAWPWQRPGNGIERLLFAKEVLNSKVIPVVNAEVQALYSRMSTLMRCYSLPGFDIIQCLGLLYHVQNPMLALHQIRRCLSDSGVMLLETSCLNQGTEPIMRLNRSPLLYDDHSSYWMPNEACLREMLALTGFTMGDDILRVPQALTTLNRICVECYAAVPNQVQDNFGT